MTQSCAYDAIIVAGGRGSRLGMVDKATLDVGDGPLLDGVLDAAASAHRIAVIGPKRDLPEHVLQAREEPIFGGPAAAVVTGLQLLGEPCCPWTLVLACDLPLARSVVPVLVDSVRDDGAVLVDGRGRPQWVAGLYRSAALGRVAAELGEPTGRALHHLFQGLQLHRTRANGRIGDDVDTWEHVGEWNDYFTEE